MSFLYLMPISVGSMMLYRHGGLAMAGICWALYASLAYVDGLWAPFGGLAQRPNVEPGGTVYLLLAHLVAMLAFALLSSFLSERVRVQGKELAEKQRAVARLKALNENIIESINSGLITTNLGGEINFMNRGGTEILRRTHREVGGRPIEQLFGLGEGYLSVIRRHLLEERRFRFERYYTTSADDKIFLGIAVSNLYDKAGQPLGYIFIFQDLTEINALEQEMRLKERMVPCLPGDAIQAPAYLGPRPGPTRGLDQGPPVFGRHRFHRRQAPITFDGVRDPARPQHALKLAEGGERIGNINDRVARDHAVEARVGKRQESVLEQMHRDPVRETLC